MAVVRVARETGQIRLERFHRRRRLRQRDQPAADDGQIVAVRSGAGQTLLEAIA